MCEFKGDAGGVGFDGGRSCKRPEIQKKRASASKMLPMKMSKAGEANMIDPFGVILDLLLDRKDATWKSKNTFFLTPFRFGSRGDDLDQKSKTT
ncbi:hypothetical protein L2E82_39469 [Cichorium intybus]|uniref:Uncharacterized protein n=1 Tax=Cichorium intybus TaxID=13427 RepID=A0ACB9AJ31_CICIN|nr:hypothetical protein L2E82_39469 [Cichorium intybus]